MNEAVLNAITKQAEELKRHGEWLEKMLDRRCRRS